MTAERRSSDVQRTAASVAGRSGEELAQQGLGSAGGKFGVGA